MTRMTMLLCAWLCALALIVAANPVQAAGANYLSYVSNTGNNANDCATPATACSNFVGALAKTANEGEIDCVNSGNYLGVLIITQSVTIDCSGSVGFSTGNTTINGTGIVVRLRGLTINSEGFGESGIDAQNVGTLYVENCVITNFNNDSGDNQPPYLGIRFRPSANSRLFVTDTIISNNGTYGGATGGGISVAPTSGATAAVTLDGVKLLNNVYGMGLNSTGGTIVGTLRHSTISASNITGLVAYGGGSPIFWTVDGSSITNNYTSGIQTLGSGVNLQIGNSTITGNSTGVTGPGIFSFKNNQISGNATDGTPLPTVSGGLQ
jgi:hypothetical protein